MTLPRPKRGKGYKSLGADLAAMEERDVMVKQAAERLDQTVFRLNLRAEINERRKAEGKPPLRGT